MEPFNIPLGQIMANCGHATHAEGEVTAFGKSCIIEIPIIDGKTEYCHRCLENMTIRCAWCSSAIFIGSLVTTLRPPGDKGHNIPDYAVPHCAEHNSYVGCTRWDCAETISDIEGVWHPPGRVQRVAPEFIGNGHNEWQGCFRVTNLTDPTEATKGL